MAAAETLKTKAIVRPVRDSDHLAVSELQRTNQLPGENREAWRHIWTQNPAFQHFPEEPFLGWVLEANGELVGYIGSVPLLYWHRGRKIRAAATRGWVVSVPYRWLASSLVLAFESQKCVDVCLDSTASLPASKALVAMGWESLPTSTHGFARTWFFGGRRLLLEALAQKRPTLPKWLAQTASTLAVPIGCHGFLAAAFATRSDAKQCRECDGAEFLAAAEKVWLANRNSSDAVMGDRSVEAFQWRLAQVPGIDLIFTVHIGDGTTKGYAVMARCRSIPGRWKLLDIMAVPGAENCLRGLLGTAMAAAVLRGADIVEAVGTVDPSQDKRRLLGCWERPFGFSPFLFKARSAELTAALRYRWRATLFDGDAWAAFNQWNAIQ